MINKMGCCKSKPQVEEGGQNASSSDVIVNDKLYNQDILVRKGMKSGAQFGKDDSGGLEAGFQVMFQKRKIKKYSLATNIIQQQNS